MSYSSFESQLAGIPATIVPHLPQLGVAVVKFRVGNADETMATCGLTELARYLALTQLAGVANLTVTSSVEPLITTFRLFGQPESIMMGLGRILAFFAQPDLSALPQLLPGFRHELDQVDKALDTLSWRYGFVGAGLYAKPTTVAEFYRPEPLLAHLRRYFTRANAVLGFDSPVVMDLPVLPDGQRELAPSLPEPLARGPYFMEISRPQLHATGVVAPSPAAQLAVEVLATRFGYRLGQQGIIQSPRGFYTPIAQSAAQLLIQSPDLPQNNKYALSLLADLDQLSAAGPFPTELPTLISNKINYSHTPFGLLSLLEDHLTTQLLGREKPDFGAALSDFQRLSAEDIRQVCSTWRETLVLGGSSETSPSKALPTFYLPSVAIQGQRFSVRSGSWIVSDQGYELRVGKSSWSGLWKDVLLVRKKRDTYYVYERKGRYLNFQPSTVFAERKIKAELAKHLPENLMML